MFAYFKVHSWGVYTLGIFRRNPHPHIPLPQPNPPTLYIIYAPTPTPTLVHYDVTFFDGEVWMLTSWTRLEHFTREICTYLDQEFVRIEVLLKKYICQTSASVGSLVRRRRPLISVGGSPLSDECSRVTFPCCLIEKLSWCVFLKLKQ